MTFRAGGEPSQAHPAPPAPVLDRKRLLKVLTTTTMPLQSIEPAALLLLLLLLLPKTAVAGKGGGSRERVCRARWDSSS